MKACAACEAARVCCRVCGKSVCPAHRWGTGDTSDGYYCVDGCDEPDTVQVSPELDGVPATPWSEHVDRLLWFVLGMAAGYALSLWRPW